MPWDHNDILSRWSRAGVMFGVEPATESPDLERLLLDTVRAVPTNARLLVMAVTWLARYGRLMAKHRLKRLIREELAPAERAPMGLMLDLAINAGAGNGLRKAVAECAAATKPYPLFTSMRRNTRLRELAKRDASAISRAWGCWARPLAIKEEALRPSPWITAHNPPFTRRAAHHGDLRTTIVETLLRDLHENAAVSEMALARYCLASRGAVRHALNALELEGHIQRSRRGHRTTISLSSTGREPALA